VPVYKKVNKKFFNVWTPKMAYVLGFFMADGSIDVNPRGSHYFSIQICDKMLLEEIRNVLDSEHKIATRKGIGNQKDRYRLQIGSREMYSDLEKLGVKQQKAHTMRIPDVPNKYFNEFVRGYFDGDGNVWVGFVHKNRKKQTYVIRTAFTSCSVGFLQGLQERMTKHGLSSGSLCFTQGAYRLQYSINDSILLYRLIYGNLENNLFLKRKKDRFESFLKMRGK